MTNADVLAAKISEAARKFSWLEQLDPASNQEVNDPNALLALTAGSCIMANNQAARDDASVVSRGNVSVVSRGNASVVSRGDASVASRGNASTTSSHHDISDMEPLDILAMARTMVTLPGDSRVVGDFEQREMIRSMLTAPIESPSGSPSHYQNADNDDDEEEDFEDPFANDDVAEALHANVNATNNRKENGAEVLAALAAVLLAEDDDGDDSPELERDQSRRRRGKESKRGKPKRSKRRNPRKLRQHLDENASCTDNSSNVSPRSVCSAASFVPSDDALLAKGWKKAMDSSCGRYYYYTIDQSTVVWDNPLETHDGWFSTDDERDAFTDDPFAQEEDPFALDPFDLVEEEAA